MDNLGGLPDLSTVLTLRLFQVLAETREVQCASKNHPKEKKEPLQGSSHAE